MITRNRPITVKEPEEWVKAPATLELLPHDLQELGCLRVGVSGSSLTPMLTPMGARLWAAALLAVADELDNEQHARNVGDEQRRALMMVERLLESLERRGR